MTNVAVRIEGLGKQYRLGGPEQSRTLRESITLAFTAPWRMLRRSANGSSGGSGPKYLWALKDVSFEVHTGDVVGLIGRNGAGNRRCSRFCPASPSRPKGKLKSKAASAACWKSAPGFIPN